MPTVTSSSPSQAVSGGAAALTLTGKGFVSGTVLTSSTGTVTTTYNSPTSLTAQLTLPIGATGNVTLQATNPTPGGGTGAVYQVPIATLTETATDTDGTNTGTARLGVPVSFSTVDTDTAHTGRSWTLQGPGTLVQSGTDWTNATYEPPQVMPANPTITVTVYLYSLPALTTSYTMTLINPVPAVTSATPAQLLTGGTQTLTLTGSGFVPGTTVAFNGTTLPITYVSYSTATVQVPVAANATGVLSFQVQNPAPGGGAGSTFTENLAVPAMTLKATDSDGINTGTAEVGSAIVTMSAAVTGSVATAVNWSVTGAGSISTAGVYTPPAAVPANPAVTIQAALASNPAVTASYTLNLINPVPTLTAVSPTQAVSGGAAALTLTGKGFVSGTVLTSSAGTVTTTYNSATSLTAQLTLPIGATGNVTLQATNSTPGGGTGAAYQVPIATLTETATDPDGTNTGTARLGVPVNFSTTNTDTANTAMSWTLQGAGTLTQSGTKNVNATYTPPTSMPANTSVTVTAYLTNLPALTTSYTMNLVNPVPAVTSATPAQLLTGGTQTLTLAGSGFVPGTTVAFNGTTLPITYVSYKTASIEVPVAANATGALSFQVQNPAPGGGAGSTFTENLAVPAMTLKATDSDGINTGTAEVGSAIVTMSAAVTGSVATAVNWSVTGAGSISTAGVYTPPAAVPANPAVSIQAALASNPAVTASYALNLINPMPTLTAVSPSQAVSGGAAALTLTGKGFVSGTVLTSSTGTVTTTYNSPTSLTAQLTLPIGATGNVTLQATNPTPGGGTGAAFQLPIATLTETATDTDGTNTGTARLGVPVSFSTVDTDTAHTGRSWTLQGPGTLVQSGTDWTNATYTPPTSMPANPTVTVTVYLYSLPALTTSYTMTLINPVPTVTSAAPAQLLTGGTQTLTLTGSGFVPGTTVAFNGTTLPTTYVSSSTATVQVPVAANATGALSFQVQNPAPGGGAGSTFTENLAVPAMTLTATDSDGINTGTAEVVSAIVTMSAAVTGSVATAVNWSVTGAGSISTAGVYTPPTVVPANSAVTIQAALASNPAVTASYALNLINPVPTITSASPLMLPPGATTSLTLTGTGFVPQSVILVNGQATPTTYESPTVVVASIAVLATATGSLSLRAQNPTPGGGTGAEFQQAISTPISATTAARLLDQTTFGPTSSLIQHVQQEGVTAWLTEQYNTPQTVLAPIPAVYPSYCGSAEDCVESEWWQTVITGNDQLRQRVAFALSELFVVSVDGMSGYAMDPYVNKLAGDAFTNWYTLMNDVTLSPAMGVYLNMLNSAKPTGTLIANENFGRENMQLFNLGLNLLNQDGSLQLDANNNPIPTYTQAQVQAFARAFTGWTFAPQPGSQPTGFFTGILNWNQPMIAVENEHDENPKTLLNGTTLPAGQTAEEDLSGALTNIFQHPNLPPFVCRQLIQHLVKGMPSEAYVSRVAAIFINDGNGVRGDMKAVLTAIFTDPEARAGDTAPQASDGHLREPVLWMTAVTRGLGFVNVDPNNYWTSLSFRTLVLGERPFASPSVFNFFPPGYVIPGTTLNAPEFGLENTASVIDRNSLADQLIGNYVGGFNVDLSATSPLGQIAVSQGPAALVQALSQLFLYGTMDTNTATAITNEITTVTNNPARQVQLAVYLTITSSEYKTLH